MNKYLTYTILGLFACASLIQAATSDSFTFSNYIRFGHDDNLYQDETDEIESSYISDILNLGGKLLFSNRSELLFIGNPNSDIALMQKRKRCFFKTLCELP